MILVTLVCCYAACWGPTKTQGVSDVDQYVYSEQLSRYTFRPSSSPLPLIVVVDEWGTPDGTALEMYRCAYFWFFGYVAKLPYERELPTEPSPEWNDLTPTRP